MAQAFLSPDIVRADEESLIELGRLITTDNKGIQAIYDWMESQKKSVLSQYVALAALPNTTPMAVGVLAGQCRVMESDLPCFLNNAKKKFLASRKEDSNVSKAVL